MLSKVLFFTFATASLFARPGFIEPWGKDADLRIHTEENSAYKHSIAAKAAEKVILFHQTVLSPVDGPRSHFRPTSSRYMLIAIRRFGFLKGFVKGCDRLLRENKDGWVYRTREIDGKIYKWDPPSRYGDLR